MKNLFLLPTEKPTRIFTVESEVRLAGYPTTIFKTGKSIYIINNDRIKESDWYIDLSNGKIIKADEFSEHKNYGYLCKKIILTTDVILIKYGIQAIDDEFLEWFVKNPSCEEVEVDKFYKANPKYKEGSQLTEKVGYWSYKIIISKQKTKDRIMSETSEETKQKVRDYGNSLVKQTAVELDFTSWRKKNTIMLIKGGWFGNQTPCYVGDAMPKTEKQWKELYEQFKNK